MTISVTEFKSRCLAIIRQVQREGKVIEIVRRGEIVARLLPALPVGAVDAKPWEKLRGTGKLLASAEEGVLEEHDFEAFR
jgi:prevent-host-death family protein